MWAAHSPRPPAQIGGDILLSHALGLRRLEVSLGALHKPCRAVCWWRLRIPLSWHHSGDQSAIPDRDLSLRSFLLPLFFNFKEICL